MAEPEKVMEKILEILQIIVTYPQNMWMEAYSSGEQQLDQRLDCPIVGEAHP